MGIAEIDKASKILNYLTLPKKKKKPAPNCVPTILMNSRKNLPQLDIGGHRGGLDSLTNITKA